jgi:hypothetical protein
MNILQKLITIILICFTLSKPILAINQGVKDVAEGGVSQYATNKFLLDEKILFLLDLKKLGFQEQAITQAMVLSLTAMLVCKLLGSPIILIGILQGIYGVGSNITGKLLKLPFNIALKTILGSDPHWLIKKPAQITMWFAKSLANKALYSNLLHRILRRPVLS